MEKEINLNLPPDIGLSQGALEQYLSKTYYNGNTPKYHIVKRSIDARKSNVKINLKIALNPEKDPLQSVFDYKQVSNAPRVIIVGAGPAGLFAALEAIELGLQPVIIERGKDVQSRRLDLANINKKNIVNPDSNYCFGEGGAGTYSDGKLYTRSTKRGDVKKILIQLIDHGANEEIFYDAHPHIGTNKLPKIIASIREFIIHQGGKIHFNTKVTDLIISDNELKGIVTQEKEKEEGIAVILATGHSARDIYALLEKKKVTQELKPFALGVRVEHQQSLIDSIQYNCEGSRGEYLPAAAYALKYQSDFNDKQRGVFSFCMCPGGFIVPAATAPGEIVVNGMSPSRRDSQFSNSGIVVAIEAEDLDVKQHGIMAGIAFQKEIEQMAFKAGGDTQTAPAQLLRDFVNSKTSPHLLDTSYQPGIVSAPLHELLPSNISYRLQRAFKHFNKIMPNYLTNEAQILAVESRTSSPVKIPRDKETLEHINLKRLFPCGEGAGYAGGIISAAIDGQRCMEMVKNIYAKNI